MKKKLIYFFILLSAWSYALEIPDYHLDKPDKVYHLPPVLSEISGFVPVNDHVLACIQDEKGVIYYFDMRSGEISGLCAFAPEGDYEGIALVGTAFYVLRSDGVLFEVADGGLTRSESQAFKTGIPASNNEGLCYDAANKRLLIASKSDIGIGKKNRTRRAVYGFDPVARTLISTPLYELDIDDLDRQVFANGKGKDSKRQSAEKVDIRFSDVAIHPLLPLVFALSAVDHRLIVFHVNGQLLRIVKLDSGLFNKPEGISFSPNGDLYVSNEGETKKATVLRFDY